MCNIKNKSICDSVQQTETETRPIKTTDLDEKIYEWLCFALDLILDAVERCES